MADVFITDIAQTSEIDDSMELVGDNGFETYSFTVPTLKKHITKDFVRPNLLDNWYFLNAVNQRGNLKYATAGVCIDRWVRTSGAGCSVYIDEQGITIENNSNSTVYFRQYFENPLPVGTYTLSAVIAAGNMTGCTLRVAYVSENSFGPILDLGTDTSIGSITFFAEDNIKRVQFSIPAGASMVIEAVKLESGSGQTLANKKTTGVWEFNEIPDYGEQLAKCQRHFVRFANFGSYLRSLGTGLATNSTGTNARFSIPVPAPMRTKPSISVSSYSSVYCYRAGGRTSVTELKVIDNQGDMGNVIVADATTSGLTAQEICNLVVASCIIELSAEITS